MSPFTFDTLAELSVKLIIKYIKIILNCRNCFSVIPMHNPNYLFGKFCSMLSCNCRSFTDSSTFQQIFQSIYRKNMVHMFTVIMNRINNFLFSDVGITSIPYFSVNVFGKSHAESVINLSAILSPVITQNFLIISQSYHIILL